MEQNPTNREANREGKVEFFPTPYVNDGGHEWAWVKWSNGTWADGVSCRTCGVMRRSDGQNRPCRGKVEIVLRDPDVVSSSWDVFDQPITSADVEEDAPQMLENLHTRMSLPLDAAEQIAGLRAEVDGLRASLRKMHRRAQKAESLLCKLPILEDLFAKLKNQKTEIGRLNAHIRDLDEIDRARSAVAMRIYAEKEKAEKSLQFSHECNASRFERLAEWAKDPDTGLTEEQISECFAIMANGNLLADKCPNHQALLQMAKFETEKVKRENDLLVRQNARDACEITELKRELEESTRRLPVVLRVVAEKLGANPGEEAIKAVANIGRLMIEVDQCHLDAQVSSGIIDSLRERVEFFERQFVELHSIAEEDLPNLDQVRTYLKNRSWTHAPLVRGGKDEEAWGGYGTFLFVPTNPERKMYGRKLSKVITGVAQAEFRFVVSVLFDMKQAKIDD